MDLNPPRCRYALYSSLSPGLQTYLEGLSAVHSAVAQAEGNRAAGLPVRRAEIETVHPIIRVHPTTGWKSVYVNPGKRVSSTYEKLFSLTPLLLKVSHDVSLACPRPNQMPS